MSATVIPEEFSSRLPRTAAVVGQGMERRLHCGAQLYLSLNNETVADVGLGWASPDVAMTAETVNPWLSAGKPLTAVLLAQLVDTGQLDWDALVSHYIPEFDSSGKTTISLRHLLSHTAGLHAVNAGWPQVDWNESLQRIYAEALPADWIVGESAAYDPGASWFVLGEIVQHITQQNFADALTEFVLKPAGMPTTWAALSPSDYEAAQGQLGRMWERQQGQLVPTDWETALRGTRPSPGSSLRGPIRDLGRFYEWLRDRANSLRQFPGKPPRSSAELLKPQRIGKFDQTLGHLVDFGLGFLLDSNRYGPETVPYGYGRFCSPRTFGHGGSQCSQGYCDPEHGLVVAYVFNGRPGEGQHQRRLRALNEAIYQDLNLAE